MLLLRDMLGGGRAARVGEVLRKCASLQYPGQMPQICVDTAVD